MGTAVSPCALSRGLGQSRLQFSGTRLLGVGESVQRCRSERARRPHGVRSDALAPSEMFVFLQILGPLASRA